MTPAAGTSFRERRSATRLAAIQALYALDVSGSAVDRVIADFVERPWAPAELPADAAKPDEVFLRTLVEGVVAHRPEIDVAIQDALTGGWTLARLEILLQAILRAGAYELSAQPDVPAKVVINEYLEIAHAFFAGKEPSLVNAVLDRLTSRFRGGAGGGPVGNGRADA
jgi:N utilization substance protein B